MAFELILICETCETSGTRPNEIYTSMAIKFSFREISARRGLSFSQDFARYTALLARNTRVRLILEEHGATSIDVGIIQDAYVYLRA